MQPKSDVLGRLMGAGVFFLGVIVVLWVLKLAYALYADPLPVGGPQSPAGEVTFAALAAGLSKLLARILLLIVGSISGSLLASRGVRLYAASSGRTQPTERE